MSSIAVALVAAIQNDNTIGPLITGVISGRNFNLQDEKLSVAPNACVVVMDLPFHESPYLGTITSSNVQTTGQIEIRCISKTSEQAAKDLADAVRSLLWSSSTLTNNGLAFSFHLLNLMQVPDTFEDLSAWLEILTVDYES